MATLTDLGERIARTLKAKGLTPTQVVDDLRSKGVRCSKQYLHQVMHGPSPARRIVTELAKYLEVDPTWLRIGSEADGTDVELALTGTVKAGQGDLTEYIIESQPFPFKASWSVVKVEGMSAYPVVYPDQFVIVDSERTLVPDTMTKDQTEDIHDNIVVVILKGDPPLAYLKRFCREPDAPEGYVMASVDGGRGSPYIAPWKIERLLPVVGVIFEDPRFPRIKGKSSKLAKPKT